MKILRPPLHENFGLPAREDLLKVKPGDHIKLLFDGKPIDRMWVKVTSCDDDQVWSGTIANNAVGGKAKFGEAIDFHPYDIICT